MTAATADMSFIALGTDARDGGRVKKMYAACDK
jgi:hypothetical protein